MYRFRGKILSSNESIQLCFQMKAYCWKGFDQICSFSCTKITDIQPSLNLLTYLLTYFMKESPS